MQAICIIRSVLNQQNTVYPKKYAHGFALLCLVVVIHWLTFPYPSGLLHWHCGNLTIAPVPAKQPWWIWINTSCEFIMNDCITTTKQSTTKPCAYFLGYTVCMFLYSYKWDYITRRVNSVIIRLYDSPGRNRYVIMRSCFIAWIVEGLQHIPSAILTCAIWPNEVIKHIDRQWNYKVNMYYVVVITVSGWWYFNSLAP